MWEVPDVSGMFLEVLHVVFMPNIGNVMFFLKTQVQKLSVPQNLENLEKSSMLYFENGMIYAQPMELAVTLTAWP